jgi:Photoprotection regulator fluorescence recovery protein
MDDSSRPNVPDAPPTMGNLRWSPAEKAIARKVFDRALQRELEEVVQDVKKMAASIKEASDMWELERFLTRRRKEIDQLYDYRYSVLPLVFANLVSRGRIQKEELNGLTEDKLRYVQLLETR